MNYYFKKTFRGMVLIRKDVKQDRPLGDGYRPSSFKEYWRKATEKECQEFIAHYESLKEKEILINEIRESNPELFI